MEQLCLLETSRNILFLSSLQRKLKHCPLIDLEKFSKVNNTPEYKWLTDASIVCAVISGRIFTLVSKEHALKNIEEHLFYGFRDLSFDGYCLAGGAAMWAIRNIGDYNHSSSDMDFFPVVGEITGNNWQSEKQARALQIYEKFCQEMIRLKKRLFHYKLLIWKNDNCTTFSFYHDYKLSAQKIAKDCPLCLHGLEQKIIKLSFIHRAYNTPDQILQGFDFPAAQVLYDGTTFKCSYAALWSLHYNVLPVDVSSASDSFYARLHKYGYQKGMMLTFPGMNYELSKTRAKTHKPWKGDTFRILFPKGANLWFGNGHNGFNLGYGNNDPRSNPIADPENMAKESDYGDAAEYVMAQKEIFELHSTKQYLLHGEIHRRKRSCQEPFQAPDIEMAIRRLCSFDENNKAFDVGQFFPKIFGEDAEKAIVYYTMRQQEKFNWLLEGKIFDILREYQTKIASDVVKFKVDEPGMQTRRSFHPVDLTARGFYGEYYNGFHCTVDWQAKCQILVAYKKERTGKREKDECCLFWLDLNLIKYVFLFVDLFHMKELMSRFL
jgi:hypothetical protein